MNEIQPENAAQLEYEARAISETRVKQKIPGTLEGQGARRSYAIYALFLGNSISYIGDTMALLAIPWFVLQTTGSVEQAGIAAFFSTLPMVLSAFFGSALIDRLGYKRSSVIGDILSGLTVLFIPALYHTIGLAFWQLLILVFIGGLLRSPADAARWSMVPDLAELARMRLERANAWNDGVRRAAYSLGAPLAGLLIAIIGTNNLLWLDAASFALSALTIGFFVPKIGPQHAPTDSTAPALNYIAELKEGLRFVRLDTVILTVLVVCMITNMIDGAYSGVVGPAYILHTFHNALYLGILISVFGAMSFVGAMIFGTIGHRFPRRLTFGICFTVGGALRFWFLLTANFPLIVGWALLAGLAIGCINPLIDTTFQDRVPPAMRARVFGLLNAGTLAGIPVGTFVSGFVVTWIGLNWTLALMGALYLLATLSILVNPALKRMERGNAGQV